MKILNLREKLIPHLILLLIVNAGIFCMSVLPLGLHSNHRCSPGGPLDGCRPVARAYSSSSPAIDVLVRVCRLALTLPVVPSMLAVRCHIGKLLQTCCDC